MQSDASGLLHSSSDPGGTISYVYNPEDKIKQITSPSGNTVIGYDDYGYQSSLDDIDAGSMEYEYNAFGELESQTDAKGNHQTLVYDNIGRIQSLSWNGGDSVLYNYDDRTGQLRSITSSNGIKKRFEYDELNRLSERIDSINGSNRFTAVYNYLSTGEIDNVLLNQDVTIDYTYNSYGYLDQVSANSELVWDASSMNEYGITDNFTLGNQAVTSINFNSYGFTEEITTVRNGTYLQNWNYDFNIITGNLTSRTGLNSSGNSMTESFTYDDLNRLLTYTAGQDTLSVSYDGSGYGNITGKTDVGTYDYTGGVHKVTSVTNPTVLMQNRSKQHIEYTKFNKVGYIRDSLNTGAERELFITYGPDQQRVKTLHKEDGRDVKTKYFALGQYEKEIDSTGNVRELYYISGSDGVVAALQRMNEQDSIFYINKDHLGSFDVITNPDGSVREMYNYDPWGRRRNPADWSYNNVPEEFFLDRGFTGHEHLDKLGLINMNGRVYDPVMALFLSPDNFVQSPDLTQNFNRYTYCLNSPLKYSDPTGMTYYKLEGNDWVAFEYNPFTEVGVDFRTASGGGIALEGPSYEELKTNSGNGANGEYGLPGQSYGEGTNGPGVGGIYYDCVSHTFHLINNPGAGGFYIEANAFEAFTVGLLNNPSGQGVIAGLSFEEVAADIRNGGVDRFVQYLKDKNYGGCFFIKAVDNYSPANLIPWKLASQSINYGRKVGRWGHQYFPNPDYGELRHIIGSFVIAEKYDPITAWNVTWGNEYIGLGLDIRNLRSRLNGAEWAFQFSDVNRNYQGIWYSIIY